ncbi:MerR family transcriptional regulator [Actinomadura hibisca]|uniref:MerR family transcriptional regulator n=1 Tax=Actinomadura hibisca TaxID=68565 RepID=UPI0009FCB960
MSKPRPHPTVVVNGEPRVALPEKDLERLEGIARQYGAQANRVRALKHDLATARSLLTDLRMLINASPDCGHTATTEACLRCALFVLLTREAGTLEPGRTTVPPPKAHAEARSKNRSQRSRRAKRRDGAATEVQVASDISEPSLTLSIQGATDCLGIPESTLRTWDRRYDLGASHRTDGGHRRYTWTDLRRLAHMQKLISQGFPTGEAARAVLGTNRPQAPRA